MDSQDSIINAESFKSSVNPARKAIKIFYNTSDTKDLPVPLEKRVFHPSHLYPVDCTGITETHVTMALLSIFHLQLCLKPVILDVQSVTPKITSTDSDFNTLLLTIGSVMDVNNVDNLIESADLDGMETCHGWGVCKWGLGLVVRSTFVHVRVCVIHMNLGP